MGKNTGGGNSHGLSEFIAWRFVKDKCFPSTFYLFIHKEQIEKENTMSGALSDTWLLRENKNECYSWLKRDPKSDCFRRRERRREDVRF